MDFIPSSSPNYHNHNSENGSVATQNAETIELGEHSLSASPPEDCYELMSMTRRIKESYSEKAFLQAIESPPALESKLLSIAQSRKPSSIFVRACRAIGNKAVNLGSKIFHCLIWRCINTIRESATTVGGKVTFNFSQSKGKWLGNMVWDPSTRGGVCWGLSMHWLKHRCQGTSLFHRIYDGPHKGNINEEVFEEIRALQEASQGKQTFSKKQWLQMNNMVLKEVEESYSISASDRFDAYQKRVNPYVSTRERATPENFSKRLAMAITAPENASSSLKMISFGGRKCAHAVSAHIDPDSNVVTFFDPNYGEFQFSSSEAFSSWFTKHFWPKSKYGASVFAMNQYFTVNHIEPSGENNERSI